MRSIGVSGGPMPPERLSQGRNTNISSLFAKGFWTIMKSNHVPVHEG